MVSRNRADAGPGQRTARVARARAATATRTVDPGVTTPTESEFATARATFIEITEEAFWNPWVEEDRAEEYDAAITVMDRLTRAEPGFRELTREESAARLARYEAEFAEKRARREQQRRDRVAHYDDCRHHARLALLEDLASLDSLQAGSVRDDNAVEKIAATRARIDVLRPEVGDPETVIDQRGWLPGERRERNLALFTSLRHVDVRQLRKDAADLQSRLVASTDRGERSRIRDELAQVSCKHDRLAAIPRLAAEDMCADCATPVQWHGFTVRGDMALLGAGPCPAWPTWSARISRARDMLAAAAASARTSKPQSPVPTPVAIIPSGLPIEKIIAQLTAVQADHPGAVVRRGNRNRWEIWPA